jgi:hypothetical protein
MLKTCPIPWRPPISRHDLHAEGNTHGDANASGNSRNHCWKDHRAKNPVLVGAKCGGEAWVDRVDVRRGVERGDDQHDEV